MPSEYRVEERKAAEPPPSRSISVRTKMILLLAITVSAVAVAYLLLRHSQDEQLDLLVREHAVETTRVLHRVLDLRASGASVHADDYTRWDDFVKFAKDPDPRWGQLYLTENIATFGIDVAWVLDERFRLIYTANPKGDSLIAGLPEPLPVLVQALRESPIRHFYASNREGLLEVWTSSIQPSSDLARRASAAGYYVIGRLWTPTRIAELASLMDGNVTVIVDETRATGSSASSHTGLIRIAVPLTDIRGLQVAVLDYAAVYPVAPRVHATLGQFLLLIMSAALLFFVGISLALTRWVGRPLALITASLRQENPSLLQRTMTRDDEFGRLARLVRDFFAQRGHLIEARLATEAAARAKQVFLANISHELRTPMHGIISFSRIGVEEAKEGPREELLDYFKQVAACGTTLLKLLDDLLDLAKFDSGRMRLDFSEVALDQVAKDAAREFAMLYQERDVTLNIRIAQDLDPVRADGDRLRQVFRNLLSNAAKFTPAGGQVGLMVARQGSMARVTVDDSGKGIPSGELEAVFDRFSQASNNRASSGGTGLGLPLCREIVQLHGGRIWAENRAPRGTRMVFEVPFGGPPARVSDDTSESSLAA